VSVRIARLFLRITISLFLNRHLRNSQCFNLEVLWQFDVQFFFVSLVRAAGTVFGRSSRAQQRQQCYLSYHFPCIGTITAARDVVRAWLLFARQPRASVRVSRSSASRVVTPSDLVRRSTVYFSFSFFFSFPINFCSVIVSSIGSELPYLFIQTRLAGRCHASIRPSSRTR